MVFEALTQPHRTGARAWLFLADDVARQPRRRLNELINRDVRQSFGA